MARIIMDWVPKASVASEGCIRCIFEESQFWSHACRFLFAWPAAGDSGLAPPFKPTRWPFQESLAHQLLAAADFVLVPSRFEPCGLVAQAALRYGAVPIVTAVGGLRDLVAPEARSRAQCKVISLTWMPASQFRRSVMGLLKHISSC